MFTQKKYRLLAKESVTAPNGETYEAHRIQALIDIPLHDVKKGDIGGYVTEKKTLSHKGSCWVGGNAVVIGMSGFSTIDDDALVTDSAFVGGCVAGTSKVYGNAKVYSADIMGNCDISGNTQILKGYLKGNVTVNHNARILDGEFYAASRSQIIISGHAVWKSVDKGVNHGINASYGIHTMLEEKVKITGKSTLDNVKIKGNCKIDADIALLDVTFSGDNTITGTPQIKPETKFSGTNVIGGTSIIPPKSHVHGVVMDKGILNYAAPGFSEQASISGAVFSPALPELASSVSPRNEDAETNEHIALIEQIEAEYEAYTTDIVKLIKYPAMVDTSIPEVRDFTVKLRSVKRSAKTASKEKLAELSEALETAFVCAENKVLTLVASHLDEEKKKSLKTAEKMFQLACDEASTEPEKKLSYKAGMRSLEGVILISDKATEKLKERIGILELES